jgi:cation diffusion facilitator family transporter
MSDCGCKVEAENAVQRKVLAYLLLINGTMFVVEMITGVLAGSTALIADSLDMLADATVYGISLYAVGKSQLRKARAASLSGIFQMTLAGLVLLDVVRKFVSGSEPDSTSMIGVGAIALAANTVCLWLISKHREGDVHMRASWIFSKNDVIANISVMGAGLLVILFNSRLPDLFVGLAIALLVFRGGIQILQEARGEKASNR